MLTWRAKATGFWALLHPGPSIITAIAYCIFAIIAAQGLPSIGKLILTTFGMLAMQFAISTFNDYCDREDDKYSQKAKPIVRGIISGNFALISTMIFIIIMIVCYIPYGLEPTIVAILSLSIGLAYDLGLKKTPLSGIMLGIAFPMLPLLAWILFATFKPALLWTYVVGLAIGIGIHLADALPDASADSHAGMHGLTQILGHRALFVCWGLFAMTGFAMAIVAMIGIIPIRSPILLITEFSSVLALLIAIGTYYYWQMESETVRLRVNFRYIVIIALTLSIGWIAAAVA
jgi:4-hydroxybenzoate polyprenyltransferase